MKLNIVFLKESKMIKYCIRKGTELHINQTVEGETIETKIARVLQNSEPIKDGAPLIYTPRAEGVNPAYDIRTDRFDLAYTAMDKVAASKLARREGKPEMTAEKGGDVGDSNVSKEGGKGGKKEAS